MFLSAVCTVVVPRGVPVRLTRIVFLTMRRLFALRSRFADTYEERDRAMALYAPLTLIALPVVWLALTLVGYTAMFWALGIQPLRTAFVTSGSSLLTLGFAGAPDLPTDVVAFSEAVAGLILLALLITYLPSIYGAFSRREHAVAMVTILAGSPPSPAEMLTRFHTIKGLDEMEDEVWKPWLDWFVDVEESHTTFAGLPFFRSPQPRPVVDHRRRGRARHRLHLRQHPRRAPQPAGRAVHPERVRRAADDRRLLRHPLRPGHPRPPIRSRSAGRSTTRSTTGWRKRACRCGPTGTRPGGTSPAGGSTTTPSS